MIDFLKNIFTEDFINFISALSILMAANAITGVMKAVKAGEFNWKKLGLGVGEYIAWAISAGLCVAGLQIYGGNLEIVIGETTVTLLAAVEIAKKVVYCYWASKAIENFIQYSKTETTISTLPIEDLTIAEQLDKKTEEEASQEYIVDGEEKG